MATGEALGRQQITAVPVLGTVHLQVWTVATTTLRTFILQRKKPKVGGKEMDVRRFDEICRIARFFMRKFQRADLQQLCRLRQNLAF